MKGSKMIAFILMNGLLTTFALPQYSQPGGGGGGSQAYYQAGASAGGGAPAPAASSGGNSYGGGSAPAPAPAGGNSYGGGSAPAPAPAGGNSYGGGSAPAPAPVPALAPLPAPAPVPAPAPSGNSYGGGSSSSGSSDSGSSSSSSSGGSSGGNLAVECKKQEVSPGKFTFVCDGVDKEAISLRSEHVLWLNGPEGQKQVVDIQIPNYKIEELIKAGFKSQPSEGSQINVLLKKPEQSYDAQVDTLKSQTGSPKVNLQYEPVQKTLVHYPNDKPYSPLSGPILPPLAGGRPQRQTNYQQRPY